MQGEATVGAAEFAPVGKARRTFWIFDEDVLSVVRPRNELVVLVILEYIVQLLQEERLCAGVAPTLDHPVATLFIRFTVVVVLIVIVLIVVDCECLIWLFVTINKIGCGGEHVGAVAGGRGGALLLLRFIGDAVRKQLWRTVLRVRGVSSQHAARGFTHAVAKTWKTQLKFVRTE